jgi:hypothetical protein
MLRRMSQRGLGFVPEIRIETQTTLGIASHAPTIVTPAMLTDLALVHRIARSVLWTSTHPLDRALLKKVSWTHADDMVAEILIYHARLGSPSLPCFTALSVFHRLPSCTKGPYPLLAPRTRWLKLANLHG